MHRLLALGALVAQAAGLLSRTRDEAAIMFTSHHKTGTNLGLELESCFVGGNPLTASTFNGLAKRCKEQRTLDDLNWDGELPADCTRVVHFVRTPMDMVRSAYLYHRQKPAVEAWLNFSASSILAEAVPDNPFLEGETYNEYLVRMAIPVGVFAEMKGFSGNVLKDMEAAFLKTATDPRVMTVCLEEGWHDFEGMVSRMATHFGLPLTKELLSCAEKHNPSNHHFGTHTTHGSLSEIELTGLVSIIAGHDSTWFDKRFSSSPIARVCSAPATKAKNTQRTSVDGSRSFDWLDSEA